MLVRQRAYSEQVASGQHVQEWHERYQTEDAPRELVYRAQIATRGEVDPHQDYRVRVEETQQKFHQFLQDISSFTGRLSPGMPHAARCKRPAAASASHG